MTHETRVEPVHAGCRNDFGAAAFGVGPYDVNGKRGLEHREVVGDRRPADLARNREARGLEDPAAVDEDELEETAKGVTALQAKELEDVPRPIGVDRLLITMLGERRREEELRQPTANKAVP